MNNTEQSLHTQIEINATTAAVLRMFVEQYAHLDAGELRALLEKTHTPVWNNDELLDVFEVSHFEPPYVHVIKKDNGERGTVAFIDKPRLYFAFYPEERS